MPAPIALQSVVVGIDFSWPSITTMQWVSRELAPGAELVLVHALEIPEPPGILREPGATDTLEEVATEGARRRLRAAANTLARENAPCLVRRGAPDEVLTAVARELDAGMIVVGPHQPRHGLWERFDTTVERLVGRSSVPVLLVPSVPQRRLEHVLLPAEDVTRPAAAARWAEALALALGARITRLTVVGASVPSHLLRPLPATSPGAGSTSDGELADRDRWTDSTDATGDDGGVPERETAFGEPGAEILAAAARYGSLVVMGRRRAGSLRRALLGSVTREVVRGARTPVLVVPEPV